MPRTKVKLAFIDTPAKRRATFRKRTNGVLNKVKELNSLCGVDTCMVIYNQHEHGPEPQVWPSAPETNNVLNRFRMVPESERKKNMVNAKEYCEQELNKIETKLEKMRKCNKNKMLQIMHQWLVTGEVSQYFSLEDLKSLKETVDETVKDMSKKTSSLTLTKLPLPPKKRFNGVQIG